MCEIPYKFKRKFYFHAFIYYVHEFVETPKERKRTKEVGKKIWKKKSKSKSPNHQIKIKMEIFVWFFPILGHLSFQKKNLSMNKQSLKLCNYATIFHKQFNKCKGFLPIHLLIYLHGTNPKGEKKMVVVWTSFSHWRPCGVLVIERRIGKPNPSRGGFKLTNPKTKKVPTFVKP